MMSSVDMTLLSFLGLTEIVHQIENHLGVDFLTHFLGGEIYLHLPGESPLSLSCLPAVIKLTLCKLYAWIVVYFLAFCFVRNLF